MPSGCLKLRWMTWSVNLRTLIEFVHVPRTGGYNIRTWSRRYTSGNKLKYSGHQPAKQDTIVLTILRHPVDRVISCYNCFYHKLNRPESIVEMVQSNFIYTKKYVDYWFGEKDPDYVIRFDNINNDWALFSTLHNLGLPNNMTHMHRVDDKYVPSDTELDFLHEHYESDINYYKNLMSQLDSKTLKVC